jgi:mannan endo-1,4-beta-mannosidase
MARFLAASLTALVASALADDGYVTTSNGNFVLNGQPFYFLGTNTYYLLYEDKYMVDDVFARCQASNISVLRTWAWIDVGFTDGSGSIPGAGPKNGLYFRAYDNATNSVVINHQNLSALDYVVYSAKKHNVKLILTLTNNWSDFGGMDQVIKWLTYFDTSYTTAYHDDFYRLEQPKQWQKEYVQALATRTNIYTNATYADEPAILGWELANEPRCQGSFLPTSKNCTQNYAKYDQWPSTVITGWVAEMSAYVKSVLPNHLVAVGDEGFSCESYQTCSDTTCDCYYGVDSYNFSAVPTIDFVSLHLYPQNWGKDVNWGSAYITNHSAMGKALNKPVLLGEFGVSVSDQPAAYQQWINDANQGQLGGLNFWMMCGREDDSSGDNGWYPSYDGLCVYFANAGDPTPRAGNAAVPPILAAAAQARAAGKL